MSKTYFERERAVAGQETLMGAISWTPTSKSDRYVWKDNESPEQHYLRYVAILAMLHDFPFLFLQDC